MKHILKGEGFSVTVDVADSSASFYGSFGDITLLPTAVFRAGIERISTKEEYQISSESRWKDVSFSEGALVFSSPEGCGDITVRLTPETDSKGISWFTEIINRSDEYSVVWVDYPIPTVTADSFNMFVPSCSGRVIADIGNKGFKMKDTYPHHYSSMQYFAYYGKESGIYLGIHDENACMKDFVIEAEGKTSSLTVSFPAIGAGRKNNSFTLGGYIRWEYFRGDWFDCAMIYKAFVHAKAKWLPEITEKGRPDTPDAIKDIAYWIVEYMPNSPEQRDVRPKKLGAVSHLYHKDYWFDAPVQLQRELDVPVGYHIYNWHNNPFNINYPHFTPKDEYFRGLGKLKEAGIRVMPYINGVSWETDDADEGFGENFANTGRFGAAVDKFGQPFTTSYPQKKVNGEDTRLAAMCPSFPKWRQTVDGLARMLENEMDVDGIYFDEIAAHNPHPCRSEAHGHAPGGGSYWVEGYNSLMDMVKEKKKDGVFYVSESSGEPYMRSFDGYLTWLWRQPDDVPAFSAIYAGYIVMLGRFSDGIDKSDYDLFKTNIAKSLLYGQQAGWLFADLVYDRERVELLKRFVRLRYRERETLNNGEMLRPPRVIMGDGVMAAGWKRRDNGKISLFVTNTSDKDTEYTISFSCNEYGVDASTLHEGFTLSDGVAVFTGNISKEDCVCIKL